MLERYWAWNYEIKDLGFWPGEGYKGHNMPVEVVKAADAQATIADLQGQLNKAQNELDTASDQIPADMDGDTLSVALIKLKDERSALQQRVAQLERERDEFERRLKVTCLELGPLMIQHHDLKADHARVLQERDWLRIGCNILIDRASNTYHTDGDEFIERVKRWRALDLAASLPAQPAQGGGSKEATT